MKIGFIGLGKMGAQMVARLQKAKHEVVVTDLDQAAVAAAAERGAIAAADRDALVAALPAPAVVWLMIPAQFVDSEIDALLTILPHGSIIIDGGNSDFRLTRKRAERCAMAGVELIDVGTSGGILGLKNGFSMMVGGDKVAFATVEPIIQALAQSEGYQYFGTHGAGHYIKMVHNAIEYGMMESYAEGFRLLKEGADYPGLDLGLIANVWQHGSIIASNLNSLSAQIFAANPELSGVEGFVAESGEARWALETARAQQMKLPAVQIALDVRRASEQGQINFATKVLAAMRHAFGGHKLNK
ncbi:MAG TPA: decarboxylating 6-phosphogluconate dehydrogenase [Candidatus Saccharimonadales bacterium]|nr:decarboxylating 6-phosphogluconate dehydrogenase [Candidatus Saccharimonadales bacterium]